ncbi:MAG: aminopeptidase [Clostridia bacterium]|nr:aminopeptidase [Clostridia bacterium]
MGVKKGETVLVVSDKPLRDLGLIFFEEAVKLETEAIYLEIIPRENHGVEPPVAVAEAMKKADVVLLVTSKSLSHTAARERACEMGARVASMPGITPEMMARTLLAGYKDIAENCRKYAEWIKGAKEVHLKTAAGTDLKFSIEGREIALDTGILHSPGDFGNLPAGEVFVAPVEGTAQGILVVDGSMAGIGVLEEPIKMEVREGYVVNVTGGKSAESLKKILDCYGKDARNIAELGIGFNPRARLTGSVLEDEKVLGTVHIALGDNSTFGGRVSVPSHLDGVILKPTLLFDGEIFMKEGRIVLEL